MLGLLYGLAVAISLAGAQSELCSHVETISRWSNGQRKFLKLNIDQHYTSWNISINFDREVSFEAWKGDVVKVSNTSYTLTNKCFNNILYPCQCLELGYLIRYAPGFNPSASFLLNGAPAPACLEPPACSGLTTTPAPGTSGAVAEDDHGCTVDGTCPEGTLCTVTGENFNDYTCNCPQTSTQTGSGANITCTANTTNLLRSLENEASEVTSFLESQGLNSTAFSELGDLMTGLEADEVELEDYFNILFNSSEATDLLAASTGANAEAQQAVIDALEGDTEAIKIFTETLDDDFALGRKKRRRRRQSTLSNKQIKILIRQFRRYVRKVKRILINDGLYQEMLRLEELLAENNCTEAQVLLKEIEAEIVATNFENWIINAYTVKLELLDNIDAVLAHKQSFKFWRTLSIWITNIDKILRGYLIIDLSELQCPSTEITTMAPVTEPSPAETSVSPPSQTSVQSPSQTVSPPSQSTQTAPPSVPSSTQPTVPPPTQSPSPSQTSVPPPPQSTVPPPSQSTISQPTISPSSQSTMPSSTQTPDAATSQTTVSPPSGTVSLPTTSTSDPLTSTTSVSAVPTTTASGQQPVELSTTSSGEQPVVITTQTTGEQPVIMTTQATGEQPVLMTTPSSSGEQPVVMTNMFTEAIPVTTSVTGEQPVPVTSLTTGELPHPGNYTGEQPILMITTSSGEQLVLMNTVVTGEQPITMASSGQQAVLMSSSQQTVGILVG